MADGAISYYVDHFVQTRVSKLTYGSQGNTNYDPKNPEHRKRPIDTSIPGVKLINEIFLVILSGVSYPLGFTLEKRKISFLLMLLKFKNQQVPEINEVRRSHVLNITSLECLSSVKLDIYCYRGIVADKSFMDTNPGEISKIASSFFSYPSY